MNIMLHPLQKLENQTINSMEMSVLERQRERTKLQETVCGSVNASPSQFSTQEFHGDLINRNLPMDGSTKAHNELVGFGEFLLPKPDYNGGGEVGFASAGSVHEMDYSVSRSFSHLGTVESFLNVNMEGVRGGEMDFVGKMGSNVGGESFKKRKVQELKIVAVEETSNKKIKGYAEKVNECKFTDPDNKYSNKRETSADSSRENSKVSEVQKPDYIHVRARRGQATDSHSLAERVRREKISERMKYLQDLVPGCNKIIGKAGMLDEIINYVQSLQRKVEFLSMKLATVNSGLDFNLDGFFTKEMFKAPTLGMLPDMANPSHLQLNAVQQVISSSSLPMVIDPSEISHGRSAIAPASVSEEAFLDASCFSQNHPCSNWRADLQSICNTMEFNQQGRSTAFPSLQFPGPMEADNNLKMKM